MSIGKFYLQKEPWLLKTLAIVIREYGSIMLFSTYAFQQLPMAVWL